MFKGINTPVVFLQNVLVDMILGLKMYDVFGVFDRHIRKRYKAEPGYITMNMPALVDALASIQELIILLFAHRSIKLDFACQGERTL